MAHGSREPGRGPGAHLSHEPWTINHEESINSWIIQLDTIGLGISKKSHFQSFKNSANEMPKIGTLHFKTTFRKQKLNMSKICEVPAFQKVQIVQIHNFKNILCLEHISLDLFIVSLRYFCIFKSINKGSRGSQKSKIMQIEVLGLSHKQIEKW